MLRCFPAPAYTYTHPRVCDREQHCVFVGNIQPRHLGTGSADSSCMGCILLGTPRTWTWTWTRRREEQRRGEERREKRGGEEERFWSRSSVSLTTAGRTIQHRTRHPLNSKYPAEAQHIIHYPVEVTVHPLRPGPAPRSRHSDLCSCVSARWPTGQSR